jgi:hypothetical protein
MYVHTIKMRYNVTSVCFRLEDVFLFFLIVTMGVR